MITTVSARNVDFVRELGANEAIDYKSHRFEDEAGSVDVVFDAVGGDTLQRSWALLNPNGRLVTIAAESEGTSNERAKQAFFIVRPDRAQLVELGRLLDTGELRPFVDTVLPLSKAWDAYSGKAKGKGRGKLVISLKWPD